MSNNQISQKISKNLNLLKIFFLGRKNKNVILLVLPFEEISIRPELFSPHRFRIQGGQHERDGGRTNKRRTEILVSNIGCSQLGKTFFLCSVAHVYLVHKQWQKFIYRNKILTAPCLVAFVLHFLENLLQKRQCVKQYKASSGININ